MGGWIGLGLFAVGTWLACSGLAHRRRVRVAQGPAPSGHPPVEVPATHASLAVLRDVMPTLTIAFLVFVALKSTLLYWALGGSRLFSALDLAGFLVLLAGYGTWLHCKAKFRAVAHDQGGPGHDELDRTDRAGDEPRARRSPRPGGLATGLAAPGTAAPRADEGHRRPA